MTCPKCNIGFLSRLRIGGYRCSYCTGLFTDEEKERAEKERGSFSGVKNKRVERMARSKKIANRRFNKDVDCVTCNCGGLIMNSREGSYCLKCGGSK
jgi:hypothetical protein